MTKKQREWDIYFLKLAKEVSKNSKCLSRKVGTILVYDNAIISTGYNGPARGMSHCNERELYFYYRLDKQNSFIKLFKTYDKNICPRQFLGYSSGQGLHLCQAGHAERNALIQAARNGISTKDTTLYCYCPLPCLPCMIEIINSGVKRLIYLKGQDYDTYSRILLQESQIIDVTYKEKELK